MDDAGRLILAGLSLAVLICALRFPLHDAAWHQRRRAADKDRPAP